MITVETIPIKEIARLITQGRNDDSIISYYLANGFQQQELNVIADYLNKAR